MQAGLTTGSILSRRPLNPAIAPCVKAFINSKVGDNSRAATDLGR